MTDSLPAFSPWQLGAALYVPGNRRDLLELANGVKFPELKSMIFCTEDAVHASEVESCVRHLSLALQGFNRISGRFRFIRPRNPDVLSRFLACSAVDKIDGFVLPKFDLRVFNAYIDQLRGARFKIMPTLETRAAFDEGAMNELRQALSAPDIFANIAALRIGGNDLLNLLGIRRGRRLTLYDTPLAHVVARLVACFKPYGFSLSAPVFDYLDDPLTLYREIQLDIAYGLTGKTAIHPRQVPQIEKNYRVTQEEYEMALRLTHWQAPAVFKLHDALCEVSVHGQWAGDILSRHRSYGCKMPDIFPDVAEFSG